MSVDATTGTFISLTKAESMVATWVALQSSQSMMIDSTNPKALAFGKEKIQQIIDQPGCIGLRIYNGVESGSKNMIFVGVDITGNDLVNGLILDYGRPCPNECPTIAIHQ
jgi:hypothetical protein